MPTTNPRLNITLPRETVKIITRLARKEGRSVASMAKSLMLDALEQREDMALSLWAEKLEKEQVGKKRYSHKEAWG